MIGAIIGDVVGSVHEHNPTKSTKFPLFVRGSRFTDDTVMTIATADALLSGEPYARAYRRWGRRYPDAGYGHSFRTWLHANDAAPYGSWGNGSAMRVSPVAFACDTVERVLEEAERTAIVTHDHIEGVKGAQATALAVFLARTGTPKAGIRREVTDRFGYDLSRTINAIRPSYKFDVSCQGSVPEALIAFLDTWNFEQAVRSAISLGGDADTQASIAGAAAAAFDGSVSDELVENTRRLLGQDMLEVLDAFAVRWPQHRP